MYDVTYALVSLGDLHTEQTGSLIAQILGWLAIATLLKEKEHAAW